MLLFSCPKIAAQVLPKHCREIWESVLDFIYDGQKCPSLLSDFGSCLQAILDPQPEMAIGL